MKTYFDVLTILRKSGDNKLYVAVIFPLCRHEWFQVNKKEYIRQLAMIEPHTAKSTPYPCLFEIELDGEMYINSQRENH